MKLILGLTFLLATPVFAQSAEEEAIILNQELQFLEDSVSSLAAAPANSTAADTSTVSEERRQGKSLESQYFDDEEKEVPARPNQRRRSF